MEETKREVVQKVQKDAGSTKRKSMLVDGTWKQQVSAGWHDRHTP